MSPAASARQRVASLGRRVVKRADQRDLGIVKPRRVERDGRAGRAAAKEKDLAARPHQSGQLLPDRAVAGAVHRDVGGPRGRVGKPGRNVHEARAEALGQRRAVRGARGALCAPRLRTPPPGDHDVEAPLRSQPRPQKRQRARPVDQHRAGRLGPAEAVPAVDHRREGIQKRGGLVRDAVGNAVQVGRHDAGRDAHEFRESAPHPGGMSGAEVRPPAHAIRTAAARPRDAGNRPVTRHPALDSLPDLHDFAADLVPHRGRQLHLGVAALQDLDVGATRQRRAHAQHDLAGAGRRPRKVLLLEAPDLGLDEGAHRLVFRESGQLRFGGRRE